MEYLPPFVVHGTIQNLDEGRYRQRAEDYREALIGLRDGTLSFLNLDAEAYMNDALPKQESDSNGR
jgi:glutathione-regulated potassium-efflux system ancillary protein KefG